MNTHKESTNFNFLLRFIGLFVFAILPVTIGYLISYNELSYLWAILVCLVIVLCKMGSFLNHERKAIEDLIGKLSNKVLCSKLDLKKGTVSLETAHWINKITSQIWPYMTTYFEEQLKKEVERMFKSFKVTVVKVSLGDKTPLVDGIACHDPEIKDTIKLDVNVSFEGDGEIELEKFGIKGGIKNISLSGLLWVQLEQLEKQYPPFAGSVTLCFYEDPVLSYDFTDVAVILDIDTIKNLIKQEISNQIVYPNKYVIPLPPIKS